MKKQQKPSPLGRTPYYDTDTSQTSRSNRTRGPNAVPPGTVASRVQFLQSLQTTSLPGPGRAPSPAPAPPTRRRENSHTGFGRRVSNRFGPPALQSAQPAEEARVNTAHSYIGLNTPHKSHVEEHGLADNRARSSKSPDTVARVTEERSQYDVVVPWGGLSRKKSARSMGRKQDNNDMDGQRSERYGYHGHITVEATIFPIPTNENNSSTFRRDIKPHETGTLKSESSLATTSTIRRQSVRDLFEDYGIERPVGLASSNESPRDIKDTLRHSRWHRICHLCSWVNSGPSIKCWRCSHRLCSVCDAQSTQPVNRKEEVLGCSEQFSKGNDQNQAVDIDPVKHSTLRPGPTPVQKRKHENTLRPRKKSSIPSKFPDFYPDLAPASKPSQTLHPPKSSSETQPKVGPLASGARVPMTLKDSPFVIADSTAKKKSTILFPFETRIERRQSLRGRLHRNTSSRTKEKGKHSFQDESENGYVADTSLAEDELHNHSHSHDPQASRPPSQALIIFSQPPSHASHNHHHSHGHLQEATRESCGPVPEFVECRGYPRTGHISYGSSVGAELFGECQHCVDDCQCAACQSTHHSVRCCTHKDHKAMVHHHHTPQREIPPLELHFRPLPTPQKVSVPTRSITAIPPRSRSTNPELLAPQIPAQNVLPTKIPAMPSPGRLPNIPLTKRSTIRKEAPKPPTPPPWVSIPRGSLLKPPQYDPIDDVEDEDATDPFFPIRKGSAPPANNTREQSSRKVRNKQSERLWSSDHVENVGGDVQQNFGDDARQDRQDSYWMPPRKNSVVKEQIRMSSRGDTRGPSSRMKVSPPGSRRASRRFSAPFQLREQDSVPSMTQKLLQNQEQLRDVRKDWDERIETAPSGRVDTLARNQEGRKDTSAQDASTSETVVRDDRMPSRAVSTDSSKRWRLRLVDKKPSPPCGNDGKKVLSEHRLEDDQLVRVKFVSEHRLEDDQLMRREFERYNGKALSEARLDTRKRNGNGDDHDCSWKKIVLNVQNVDRGTGLCKGKDMETAGLGIMGVTVVLHFKGREDLVLKAESWCKTDEPKVLC